MLPVRLSTSLVVARKSLEDKKQKQKTKKTRLDEKVL